MIVCLRTVRVPPDHREAYLAWIAEGRAVRQAHGILAELVLEPATVDGDTVVVTIWPSHQVFDAWIATPERDALTASMVHEAVDYQPITRYDVDIPFRPFPISWQATGTAVFSFAAISLVLLATLHRDQAGRRTLKIAGIATLAVIVMDIYTW